MIEMSFQFEVAKEKQDEFLTFVREVAKPWWETHGCQAYSMWQVSGENVFNKRMIFADMATLEKVIPANEQDPEFKELKIKYDYFTTNDSRKIFMKVI